jgi:hypothetical protein
VRWRRRTGLTLLAVAALCIACIPAPKLPQPAELMPAGAVEVMPPRRLVDYYLKDENAPHTWMRGFTCSEKWPDVVALFESKLKAQGYTQTQEDPFPGIDKKGLTNDDLIRYFDSPDGKFELGIGNLKLMRDKHVKLLDDPDDDASTAYVPEAGADYFIYSTGFSSD